MNDFRSRRQHPARQSVNSKEETKSKPSKSDKKKKIRFNINGQDSFRPGTRVRDMKELIEHRYSQDVLNTTAQHVMIEENKSNEFEIKISNKKYSFVDNNYEECKSFRVIPDEQPTRPKSGSLRILYMAKALEDKLHQKRDDIKDINKEDHIVQIMMEKPVNYSKKPSRIKMTL
jgi:hypothetical protein